MMPPRTPENVHDRRERVARLLVEASTQDVDGQRELIVARANGQTEVVCLPCAHDEAEMEELWRKRHCLRDEAQRAMLLTHLAREKMRVQIARAKARLDLH